MDKRITYVELAGKSLPLNFSAKAAKEITARYGSVDNISAAFDGKNPAELVDEIIYLMHLLLTQGASYMEIMEGEAVPRYTMEQLEIIITLQDIARLEGIIARAMSAGAEQTVEVQSDPKNAETTQGK